MPRVALIFVLLSACSEPSPPYDVRDAGGEPSPLDAGADAGELPAPDVGPGLRRLTNHQYAESIHHLLGVSIVVPDLEPDARVYGFVSVWAGLASISRFGVEKYERAAFSVAHQALGDASTREALVGCAPAAGDEDACARAFLTRFLRRAWRRPASAEEISRYVRLATNTATALDDFWLGLEYAVAGILQSPNFLFRIEVSETRGDDTICEDDALALDDHALASQLSYFLWNRTPDDALLDAAERGELSRDEGLRAQATRLLDDPRARDGLRTFVTEMYGLALLDVVPKSTQVHPQFESATLRAAMREETLRVFEDLVFERNADYRELFDSRRTVVDAELAALYGLPPIEGTSFQAVTHPGESLRSGLLGHASIAAIFSEQRVTSPTMRGLFVRRVLLCHDISPPPPGVDTMLPRDPTGATTRRERLEAHLSDPICASCHSRIDPLGFGLEPFDAGGRVRSIDEGRPIDARGELDGVAFDGPVELGSALRAHPDLPSCLVRNLHRYMIGRALAPASERAAIEPLARDFVAGGHRVRALMEELVMSEGFRCSTRASSSGALR